MDPGAYQDIHRAAELASVDMLRQALEDGASPNTANPMGGFEPLHYLSFGGRDGREPRARECTKTKVRPKFELIESGGPYLPATAHKYIQLRPHSINKLRRLEVPAATAGP